MPAQRHKRGASQRPVSAERILAQRCEAGVRSTESVDDRLELGPVGQLMRMCGFSAKDASVSLRRFNAAAKDSTGGGGSDWTGALAFDASLVDWSATRRLERDQMTSRVATTSKIAAAAIMKSVEKAGNLSPRFVAIAKLHQSGVEGQCEFPRHRA
jgi:hypothetical protein